MREIKFRAWDKKKQKMFFPKSFDEKMVIQLNGVIGLFNSNKKYDDVTDRFELIQYTGLKDKNGKEIYEGDYDQDFNVIHWCEKKMGWAMCIYDFPTKEFIACHCYDCEGHFEIRELEDIEIKGNIYEGNL